MESYLEIAEKILRRTRRPMGARAILDAAYRADLVPHHLHGKTQHKTLQARLSEHILQLKRNALFYRTEPGQFFLTEFQADPDIPEKYRVPFPARRRTRDLMRGPLLAVDVASTPESADAEEAALWLSDAFTHDRFTYRDPKENLDNLAFVWTFAMIYRGSQVLSYRMGRYRDDRDTFANKRTVGFSNVVHSDYRTLFNRGDFGIIESAVTAALIDLDISSALDIFYKTESKPTLQCVKISHEAGAHDACIAFVRLECPDWFEPTSRRLSLNDLQWLDLADPPNHIEDFDPWSKMAIEQRCGVTSTT